MGLPNQGPPAPDGGPGLGESEQRGKGGECHDRLDDRTPTTTDTPTHSAPPSQQAAIHRRVHWVAAVVAVLGPTAAFLWGALGISNTQERINGFDRLAVPGAATVSVTEPGTMVIYHESAAEVARYADPTANGRPVTRWDPGTRTIVTVSYPSDAPTWQQLGLTVTGPGGTAVPVATYRSSARYDVEAGPAERWPRSRPRPPGRTVSTARARRGAGPTWPWVKTSPAARNYPGRGRPRAGDGAGGGTAGRATKFPDASMTSAWKGGPLWYGSPSPSWSWGRHADAASAHPACGSP